MSKRVSLGTTEYVGAVGPICGANGELMGQGAGSRSAGVAGVRSSTSSPNSRQRIRVSDCCDLCVRTIATSTALAHWWEEREDMTADALDGKSGRRGTVPGGLGDDLVDANFIDDLRPT